MNQAAKRQRNPQDDGGLVERCLNDEPDAWEALMACVRDLARKSLSGRGDWSVEDVEDVVQQMNLALLRDDFWILRAYDAQRARLRTYLAGVLAREVSRYRRRKPRDALSLDDLPPEMLGETAGNDLERAAFWKTAEEALSAQDLFILRLTAWGYRAQEIADILSRGEARPMTAANVRKRRERALDRLRGVLRK